MATFLILHNIRSVENVGAMFRTADAAGVTKLLCTGYTPVPVDRFGRIRTDVAKAALGAELVVPWEQADDALAVIKRLREDGVRVIALEQDTRAVDYKTITPAGDWALVVGNETQGVSADILDAADAIVEIPMKGTKESLNVATAAGIALFRMLGI